MRARLNVIRRIRSPVYRICSRSPNLKGHARTSRRHIRPVDRYLSLLRSNSGGSESTRPDVLGILYRSYAADPIWFLVLQGERGEEEGARDGTVKKLHARPITEIGE